MSWIEELKQQALAEQPRLSALRRAFHEDPELSLQEFRTAARIEEELDRLGIPHERLTDTGVVAVLKGTGTGDGAVALRADIDALPIREVGDVPYRSRNDGVMHACGHDAHTACLLGAARLLADRRSSFGGEVRLLFQPAEEIGHGALPLLRAGALEGVRRIFGLHAASDLPLGQVGLKAGVNNASVDHFTIRVHGRSAHVSTPQLGVDALYIASQIVVAVQALVTRRTSPVEPLIIGIGKLNAGTAYNALAREAVLEGTTRAISQQTREAVKRQIDETAASLAVLYGGTAGVEWEDFTGPLVNDAAVCDELAALTESGWGPGHVVTDRALSLGGDDFAEYLLRVPGCYAYLGTADPDRPSTGLPHHSDAFDLAEEALPFGAWLYAAAALHWLGAAEA